MPLDLKTPEYIQTESQLDDVLAGPQPRVVEMMGRLRGDIAILGIGGKMGVTLGLQAVRATREAGTTRRIFGVSRFSDDRARAQLDAAGIETIKCDLLDPAAVGALPDVENIVFMAGRKFGTTDNIAMTWAMNTIVPSIVSRRYAKSRIVAFSTGCVYPFVSPTTTGCTVSTPPDPIGEYAQSCLGRERAFEHYSISSGTAINLIRLNYAVELRYGVFHDIASAIFHDRPVNISMGHFNVIWQGDANAIALLQLENCASPAQIINLTGPETLSTREVALRFGELLGKSVNFVGVESELAYLNDATETLKNFGGITVPTDTLLRWNAHWVSSGGRSLSKPTHFETNDGIY